MFTRINMFLTIHGLSHSIILIE